MNTKTSWPTTLALAISTCLLAACGGGSNVRTEPVVEAAADPPPPPQSGACPSPITADCTVVPDEGLTWMEGTEMSGGRQSDHALIVKGGGILHLHDDNRFSGGTTILDAATVVVWDNLTSNVHIGKADPSNQWWPYGPVLWLGRTVNGDVLNEGTLSLRQLCGTGIDQCVETRHPLINGNYQQSESGQLEATLGQKLQVTGSAALNGKLIFIASKALNYVLPSAPSSVLVLHADGGVSGQFANWTSEELFLTGSLRYADNDVFFDATAISAAAAMAAARAGDAVTLGAASHFDAALGSIGSSIQRAPGATLTTAQRQFLASAASIQRIQDYGQAIRTFDSLSGYGYTSVADALLQQAALPAPGLINRVGGLRSGAKAGAWSATSTMLASGSGAFNSQSAGFDQWLGDHLLLGVSIGSSVGNLRFERAGGHVRDQAPQWDVYFRRNGAGGSYVLGDLGYGQNQLSLDRRIDLGTVVSSARAMHDMDVTHAYLETGRDFRVLGSRLTPFAGLSYAALHAGGFAERGNTGFELVAQPSFHERVNAVAGLRMARYWRVDNHHWMQLDFGAGYLQLLNARDDAQAAFSGTPDVHFALTGLPRQRITDWQQMTLSTGGENWAWLLSYDSQAGDETASAGVQLRF